MKRLAYLVALVVATAGLILDLPSASAAAVTSSAVLDDGEAGCLFCTNGEPIFCAPDEHHAYPGQSGLGTWARAGGAHNGSPCKDGSCETKHGPCALAKAGGSTFETDLELVRSSIDSGDPAAVSRLLLRFAGRVVVNVERSAVQVLGCTGGVVAHLPISNTLVASLAVQNSLIDPDVAALALTANPR